MTSRTPDVWSDPVTFNKGDDGLSRDLQYPTFYCNPIPTIGDLRVLIRTHCDGSLVDSLERAHLGDLP